MATNPSASLKCEFVIPTPPSTPQTVVSRWSDDGLDLPALVVVPNNEGDIVDSIHYARDHGLQIIAAGGGHSSFLPIGSKTLYLDLKNFNSVTLDKDGQLVHVGGGALVRDVIRACCEEGYYTTWPNSDAVGMVGCMLGGGNNLLTGAHGFMVDNAVSFRVITAEGKTVEVSAASKGEELALFQMLCGAGHGLAVVTSMAMKAFPLASLNMEDDKIWIRRLIFPPTAIETAANALVAVLPRSPKLMANVVYMRSPPGTPAPGTPMIVLTASYYGPENEAKEQTAVLFDEAVVQNALKAETTAVPFANATAAFVPFNVHGGFKSFSSCFVYTLTADTIVAGFQKWVDLTSSYDDTKKTATAIGSFSNDVLLEQGQTPEGKGKFCSVRDRRICVFAMTRYDQPETRETMEQYQQDFLALHRRDDKGVPRTFANNTVPWTPLEHLHDETKIAEAKRVKNLWDSDGIFWSPYV